MAGTKNLKGAFGIVGAAAGATSAVASLRKARATNDRLLLANAIAGILVALTSVLIGVRALRKDGAK
ncbi:hypothetical protein [Alloactinosynnema sp. L-07]|uniref:hypothetical protein n=1 Tax=Alloactinosynnema sp. L-07 TaxID=1653480 RepID=UPI00065EF56B|nr:hypothetical protein [Alloactinosynnema sp. L-07]CRK58895.1 hypothetical protein [Alloactinosynnema sp. L-07]